jgi:thiol-disulfide isomerase/thioredoxin
MRTVDCIGESLIMGGDDYRPFKAIHYSQADSGDNLVVVDFFAKWCHACRALFPKVILPPHPHPYYVSDQSHVLQF